MHNKLDQNFKQWLTQLSEQWAIPVEQVAISLGADEIYNRLDQYPKIKAVLANPSTLNLDDFNKATSDCWSMGSQSDRIRLNYFIQKGKQAQSVVLELITDFPENDIGAAQRIDQFVDKAASLGYTTSSGSRDWAGAALLASIILTILYPQRFVDFRQSRWHELAKIVGYPFSSEKRYGPRVLLAGKFATEIASTPTFQQYWPEGESLWIISGICWVASAPPKPEVDPVDIEEQALFPEGTVRRRLHLIRERNQTVVRQAKQAALERDTKLKCQVCGFSFEERYGELGQGFIEAHHTRPVATLKADSQTSVKDIALLCANCHRMIHRGDHTLTLEELRDQLQR